MKAKRPLVIERFRAHLADEPDAEWARAKTEAFERICEALADEEGLPRFEGYKLLERGALDAKLGSEWKPVFLEVYQQWLGYLLEHRSRPRFLSLGWWLCEPRFTSRWPGQAGLLLAPALIALTLIASWLLLGWKLTLDLRELRLARERQTVVLAEAHAAALDVERRSLALLEGQASDAELEAFLALSAERTAAHEVAAREAMALRSLLLPASPSSRSEGL